MTGQLSRRYSFVFLVLSLVRLAVHNLGLHGAYYADDFKLVFPDPSDKIYYFFSHANPSSSFYRPVEWMFVADFKLTRSHAVSWLSSGYMLISHSNAMAIVGNDIATSGRGHSLWVYFTLVIL